MAETSPRKRAPQTAKPKPPPNKKHWVSVTLTAYPGADGKQKRCRPGDLITDGPADWPPEQVIKDGWVRPADSEKGS